MIVKVQVALFGTGGDLPVLIYNEDRSFDICAPLSEDMTRAMDGDARAFFEARVVDGHLQLLEKLEEQGW